MNITVRNNNKRPKGGGKGQRKRNALTQRVRNEYRNEKTLAIAARFSPRRDGRGKTTPFARVVVVLLIFYLYLSAS